MGKGSGVGVSVGAGMLVGIGEEVWVGTAVGVGDGSLVAGGDVGTAVFTAASAGRVDTNGVGVAGASLLCPHAARVPDKKKASATLANNHSREKGCPGIFSSRRKIWQMPVRCAKYTAATRPRHL